MKLLASAAYFAVTGTVAFAWADDLPPRKPGLWTWTQEVAGEAPKLSRFCTDAATDAKMVGLKPGADSANPCGRQNLRHEGDIISYDTTCMIFGSETTEHIVVTSSGGLVEQIKSTSVFTPPVLGMSHALSTMQWAGACPPDMEPGDIETSDGIKMNAISGKISSSGNKPQQ